MGWSVVLIGIVIVLGIVAVVVERRRSTPCGQREDRFTNPTRRPSWVEKNSGHSGG